MPRGTATPGDLAESLAELAEVERKEATRLSRVRATSTFLIHKCDPDPTPHLEKRTRLSLSYKQRSPSTVL